VHPPFFIAFVICNQGAFPIDLKSSLVTAASMALRKRLIAFGILATVAPFGFAQGEIYKCPDGGGRPTYTNVKRDTTGKNCTLVSREVSVVPAQPATPRAAGAGVKPENPAARAEGRRKILESELENEEKALAGAKQKLTEQEGIRNGDERNYARVQDRLKPFQDTVEQHQKNIDQLRRELSNLK
jgi:hypothetical protein